MRKEIDFELGLSVSKEVLLDHHSLLNLLNVLQLEMNALLKKVEDPTMKSYNDFVVNILLTLSERKVESATDEIEEMFTSFVKDLKVFTAMNMQFQNQVNVILDIVEVAVVRIAEFKSDRFKWIDIPGTEIRAKLNSFFQAIENVSRQRFHIVYPPDTPGASDYLIELIIEDNRESLFAPLVIQDLIRDLAANSRKYSPQGSVIQIHLAQIENNGVKIRISDNGMGIPAEEIENVVKFKHRGSNVKEIRSMGEGFGLTKAYHVCKIFDGKFMIDSQVNEGTTIEMTMYPNQE